ncbi:cytochrome P450 4C1-like [Chrysoperla carnea]|uniref:cytochrome P450 4C1-like n=1 Tax=Chrysoperla carnea TaxID=189513 RepID=UPI001D088D00|nr:cytochrome P450 4C1-like [Chrysoperla carnea]
MNPLQLFLITCVTLLTLKLLDIWWKYARMHWSKRIRKHVQNIPGPSQIPIIGSMHHIAGSPEIIWLKLRKLCVQYPKIFKLWGLNRVSVFLLDPEYVEAILTDNKNLMKSEAYDMLTVWLGEGLLTSTGDKWRTRRKILTPAFHFNILKGFIPIFEGQSEHSMEDIDKECPKSESNVIPIIVKHSLYSLCETTMGLNIESEQKGIQTYKSNIHEFGDIFTDRMAKPWFYSEITYAFTPQRWRLYTIIKSLRTFTSNVIKERLTNWDLTQVQHTKNLDTGKYKLPMMDLLIKQMKLDNSLSYEDIREEVDTFMFEGHDTTSMGLSLFLMLLANHPEIQNKIYEEMKTIFGDSKRQATYDDLMEMTYLERCIKESLRLYPAVPVVGRTLTEDLVLKDYVLPAGIYVYVLIYDLHRNPNYWPNPNKFDPDRFLPENSVKRNPFTYVPFSAGPRNCIGQKFAILEMKSFVSKIIQEYILEPVDTPQTVSLKTDVVIRPSKPVRVKFRKRL